MWSGGRATPLRGATAGHPKTFRGNSPWRSLAALSRWAPPSPSPSSPPASRLQHNVAVSCGAGPRLPRPARRPHTSFCSGHDVCVCVIPPAGDPAADDGPRCCAGGSPVLLHALLTAPRARGRGQCAWEGAARAHTRSVRSRDMRSRPSPSLAPPSPLHRPPSSSRFRCVSVAAVAPSCCPSPRPVRRAVRGQHAVFQRRDRGPA